MQAAEVAKVQQRDQQLARVRAELEAAARDKDTVVRDKDRQLVRGRFVSPAAWRCAVCLSFADRCPPPPLRAPIVVRPWERRGN